MEDLNKPEAGRTLEIPRQGIMKAKDPLGFDLGKPLRMEGHAQWKSPTPGSYSLG
jgi:hypothetical protein